MDFIKQKFLLFVEWYLQIVQHWKAPWVKKLLTGEEINEIIETAEEGDILLVRAGGYFSTFLFWLFNLGDYTHCVYVNAKGEITDSTAAGVEKRPMLATLVGYTKAVVMRPKFNAKEKGDAKYMYGQLMKKDEEKGIGYNWRLVEDTHTDGVGKMIPDSLTCAQFIRLIVNAGKSGYMELRKRFGFLTVSPQDYYAARKKYDIMGKWG